MGMPITLQVFSNEPPFIMTDLMKLLDEVKGQAKLLQFILGWTLMHQIS